MDDQLKALVEEQSQLRLMKQSVMDFEKKLNEKINQYCTEKLGFKEDENFSIVDIIARATQLD